MMESLTKISCTRKKRWFTVICLDQHEASRPTWGISSRASARQNLCCRYTKYWWALALLITPLGLKQQKFRIVKFTLVLIFIFFLPCTVLHHFHLTKNDNCWCNNLCTRMTCSKLELHHTLLLYFHNYMYWNDHLFNLVKLKSYTMHF